ncbi:MAG: hypothetical protein U0Q15_01015 [Kineosporiaceae bacterium]
MNQGSWDPAATALRFLRRQGVPARKDEGDDAILVIESPGHAYRLRPVAIEADHDGQFDPLRRLPEAVTDVPRLLVARGLAPGTRSRLTNENWPWIDDTGSADIRVPPALVVAVNNPHQDEADGRPRGWTSSAGTVVEYLLHAAEPGDDLRVPPTREIARATGLSAGQVSKVLMTLDTQQWTAKLSHGSGPYANRVLIDRSAMLTEWAAWLGRQPQPRILGHASFQDGVTFVEKTLSTLPDAQWCATGEVAAALDAPYLTAVSTVSVYLSQPLFLQARQPGWLETLGIRRVQAGARITLSLASDCVMATTRTARHFPRASLARVYADLKHSGVRGAEAAEHLREELLGY